MEIVLFSKPLQHAAKLSLEEVGDRIIDLGFEGVDLTVRPGGLVEPHAGKERLSRAISIFREKGLSVPMLTTAITTCDDQVTRDVFEVADSAGIDYLKLGYWRYDGFGSLSEGLESMRTDLHLIRELSASFDVTPAIHTHSGDFLSANPALLWDILNDGDPANLGIYLDPAHLVAEGSRSGWRLNLDRVRDYVAMVAVKDFVWSREEIDGETILQNRWVPLGDGVVPWHDAVDHLETIGFEGPVSLHAEYDYRNSESFLDQMKKDREYLERIFHHYE